MPSQRRYPAADRQDLVQELHGQRIPDPYRWLEDAGDPRTERWTADQDLLYGEARGGWPDRGLWEQRIAALSAVDRVRVPKARGARLFLERQNARQDHPVLWVRENGAERPLVDPQRLDPAGRSVLEAWEPSAEGDLLAYQLSRDGTEDSRLWVLDVATGQVADGPVDRVRRSSIAWLPGGEGFYYVRCLPPGPRRGEERYHRRVYLHKVGSNPDADVLVFGAERDKTEFYSVAVTPDGRWLAVTATTGTGKGTDVYLADLSASPPGQPDLRPVQEGHRARTRLHMVPRTGPDDAVWLRTSWNAPRGRVMTASPASLATSAWRELISERPDATLTDLAILNGPELARPLALAVWTCHAVGAITVHDLADGRETGTVPLPGHGTIGNLSVRPEGGHEAWFSYTDYARPSRVLHYDGRTGQVTPWEAGPSGAVPGELTVRQEVARSRDGTAVRAFVISPAARTDRRWPDRPRPAILMGYGGFGASMTPAFSALIHAWVGAGGVFAVAGLRGGGEEGEDWHRDGRGERKQNVFDDFDAVTDLLLDAGWTTPGQLAILGGSNGGLLVGAALTRHPRKYAAAVCLSPLLDMARYELSGLGPSWVPEYGSAADPAQLRTLLSYSPYHHVTAGTRYPAVLFCVADGDTRVDPLHARKMCAALQHASSGEGPVLFRLERGAGHGARARSRTVALEADCLAFLASRVGLAAPVSSGELW